MMSKHMITEIGKGLANVIFMARCSELDATIESCLMDAFADERISQVRAQRIVSKFCTNLLGHKGKMDEVF